MNSKLNSQKLWSTLSDPGYRNAYVSSTVAARLAVRIYNLRKRAGWTQPELAEKAGMKQARISVLEHGDYENFTFSTLRKIAAAFNVAVLVDFVSFPDFLKWADSLSAESVAPDSFAQSDRSLAQKSQGPVGTDSTYPEQGLAGFLRCADPQIRTQAFKDLASISGQLAVVNQGARGLGQPGFLTGIGAR